MHIPEDGKTVSMIHFPRDLYVSIPGHGKNKINAAYAYGREPLLVQTIENLLEIRSTTSRRPTSRASST